MTSYLNISLDICVKLFNTISHIICSEENNGADSLSLRSNIVELSENNRLLYSEVLERETVIPYEEFNDLFYKIFVGEQDQNNTYKNAVGIYLVFIDNIDQVKSIYKRSSFTDIQSEIHLLIPINCISLETDKKIKIEYVKDIFKHILFFFAGKDNFSPGKIKIAGKEKGETKSINYISDLFANLIYEDLTLPVEKQEEINRFIERFSFEPIASKLKYIKLSNSKELKDYISDKIM